MCKIVCSSSQTTPKALFTGGLLYPSIAPQKIPARRRVGSSVYWWKILTFNRTQGQHSKLRTYTVFITQELICHWSHSPLSSTTLLPLVRYQSLLAAATVPLVCLLSHPLSPATSLLLHHHRPPPYAIPAPIHQQPSSLPQLSSTTTSC